MKIVSKTQTIGAALLVFALLGDRAMADPIEGTINFGGTNASSTWNATGITSIVGVQISGGNNAPTGSYAGVDYAGSSGPLDPGDSVTFNTFNFTDSGVTPLWTFTDGGLTYSFDATSITVVTETGTLLDVTGNGTAWITGGDVNESGNGIWTIQDTNTNGGPSFVFQASTTVPDGGSTALMIVLGLAGISAVAVAKRRKLAKA